MTILLVDGNSILNRAYYGIRPLTTKDGQMTNAIYGFLTMLEKIKADTKPNAVAIAFDLKAPTFRHKKYAGYKCTRKGMPPELFCQLQPLKDLLGMLGYPMVSCEGYEADDILGTLSKAAEDNNADCVIATGDRDSLQLVSDRTCVRLASTKESIFYDLMKIDEDYGVEPHRLIDIKAIQGDSSDCIPGVPGIGQKGATELVQRFGGIEDIYDNIETLDIKDGMRNKLIAGKESAFLSYFLGEICREVPIDTEIGSYKMKVADFAGAKKLMTQLELFSLMKKILPDGDFLANEPSVATQKAEEGYTVDLLSDTVPKQAKSIEFSVIDDENLSESYGLFLAEKSVTILPFFEKGGLVSALIFCGDNIYKSSDVNFILKLLAEDKIAKKTYDCKMLYKFAYKNGVEIKNIAFDALLAAYLLNPSGSYEPERLLLEYSTVSVSVNTDDEDAKSFSSFGFLVEALEKKLVENNLDNLLYEIELPLSFVLAKMELRGFLLDKNGIKQYGEFLQAKAEELESFIYTLSGEKFNINSPKQLGVILFEKLGLPAKKKTKTGYSTNAEVLEDLRGAHEIIPAILEFRGVMKLKSTYCDGLLKAAGSDDGRIHTTFNQTEARTGRISSLEPNLQNIPVRTPLGAELRRFFVAEEGWVLVDADYSQIELRVLAHISGDESMKKAFLENADIHTATAAEVFGMPEDLVTSTMRSRAKAVNFGIVYGIGAYSLAKDIGVTNREAANYIKSYLEHYKGIDRYMHDIVEKATREGYVETMFARKRYLPELTAGNRITKAFGERVARNMPIQGTAADIIKIAMINVEKRLSKEKMRSRLILQVHDELIVEAPENEAMKAAMILQQEMENAVELSIPLAADSSVGKTWYDAKS